MASNDIAIKVEGVSKTFKLPNEKNNSMKSAVVNFWRRDKGYEIQQALKDISFEVKKGEFFGVVGRNGSGKSTLLKLLAGIYTPDKGRITINGKLTPFIELGVGFSPELTGRENVFLNGALLGFSRKEMIEMYDEIVSFAELERFMDQKLKNYSSGMQVRLAFSIAIRAQTDVLVLDEVIAVGDADFQRKCFDYFTALKYKKQTVILVTHDMEAVRQYCDKAIMIEKAEIVKLGTAENIAQSYQRLFTKNEVYTTSTDADRWGEGGISILDPKVSITDNAICIVTSYRATRGLPAPIYGFTLFNNAGINILEANTLKERKKTNPVLKGDEIVLSWEFPNILSDGMYYLSVACCDQSATHFYQWVNRATKFNVAKHVKTAGLTNPKFVVTEGRRTSNAK